MISQINYWHSAVLDSVSGEIQTNTGFFGGKTHRDSYFLTSWRKALVFPSKLVLRLFPQMDNPLSDVRILVWKHSLSAMPGPHSEEEKFHPAREDGQDWGPVASRQGNRVQDVPQVTKLSSLLYRLIEDKLITWERTTAKCH